MRSNGKHWQETNLTPLFLSLISITKRFQIGDRQPIRVYIHFLSPHRGEVIIIKAWISSLLVLFPLIFPLTLKLSLHSGLVTHCSYQVASQYEPQISSWRARQLLCSKLPIEFFSIYLCFVCGWISNWNKLMWIFWNEIPVKWIKAESDEASLLIWEHWYFICYRDLHASLLPTTPSYHTVSASNEGREAYRLMFSKK